MLLILITRTTNNINIINIFCNINIKNVKSNINNLKKI